MHRIRIPRHLPTRPLTRGVAGGALLLGLCVLGACAAEVEPAPGPAYGYEQYPSASYDGHPVYLINGHWYYSAGDRWYYYRREPGELARRRAEFNHARPHQYPHEHGGGPVPGYPPEGRGHDWEHER